MKLVWFTRLSYARREKERHSGHKHNSLECLCMLSNFQYASPETPKFSLERGLHIYGHILGMMYIRWVGLRGVR